MQRARPRPRPIFVVSDRSCPKTDGLRPHHWCVAYVTAMPVAGMLGLGLGLEAFGLGLGLGLVFLALALFKAKVKVTNILPNTVYLGIITL